ncbi:YfiT family bacillithiol transferase [Macrococcus equi]|uniref:YfiT family bacillithiol transferase n=1 Tax=Macrococcus equi TaxID=3395462 RepID=UPI0039BE191F
MKNQYPIGRYQIPTEYNKEMINQWITDIEELPYKLNNIVSNMDHSLRNKQYRDDSWNVNTLIHHIADSHLHGYIRTKLILTEDNPNVSTFEENEWVKLADNFNDFNESVMFLLGIHLRWATILKSLTEDQLERTMIHTDNGVVPLKQMISLYAWHGNHHLEHIKIALGIIEGE